MNEIRMIFFDSLTLSAVSLMVTASLGSLMAFLRFTRLPFPPLWLAQVHGFCAFLGLFSLVYTAIFSNPLKGPIPPLAIVALVLFIIAILAGLALNILYHLKNKPLPKHLIAIHGSIASTGLVLLIISAFNR